MLHLRSPQLLLVPIVVAACHSTDHVPAADSGAADSRAGEDAVIADFNPDAAPPPPPPPPPIVPDKGYLVWESLRVGGRYQLFQIEVEAGGEQAVEVVQLTEGGGRVPLWAPDGRWIAFQHPDTQTVHVMRPDGSGQKKIFDGSKLFWLHDNSGLACSSGNEIYRVDPDSGDKELMFRSTDFAHFEGKAFQPGGITHDGRYMVVGTDLYRYGHTGDNGTFTASFAAAIVDLEAKDQVFFFGYGCAPRTPPAGRFVYHVCGDCPTKPDIYRMSLDDLDTRASYEPELAHEDSDWGHSYFPSISNDNRWLAYAATTGCHDKADCDYEIFIHYLGSSADNRTRMTFNEANDAAPSLWVGPLWKK